MAVRSRIVRGLVAGIALAPAFAFAACEPAPPRPANDGFGAAVRLAPTASGSISGTTLGAGVQPGEIGEPGDHSVWYRWVAPSTGSVTFSSTNALLGSNVLAFTGATLQTLRPVVQTGPFADDTFRVTKGTAYYLRVASTFGGAFTLRWTSATPPPNDNRQQATSLSSATGSLVVDTTAATRQPSDPTIAGEKVPATVWYRWTAPDSGWFVFDTGGSRMPAVLGIYSDDAALSRIDESAEGCDSFGIGYGSPTSTATVRFAAQAGHSYLVMAGTQSGHFPDLVTDRPVPVEAQLGDRLQLNWRSVPASPSVGGNDAFASAARISGTHGSIEGTTVGATAETGEPAHAGAGAQSSLWFAWTPTVTADYLLQATPTSSEGCPSRIAVYTGSAVNRLTAVPASSRPTPLEQLAGLQQVVSRHRGRPREPEG